MENLASILKESIMELVDNINKNPDMVNRLGNLVAKSGFDWSFMEAIICGLKEDWVMDKAIQVMVDTWNEYVSKNDDICYVKEGYTTMYGIDEHGLYSQQVPMMKMLKHLFLERDLKSVRDGELERRKVDEKFKKKIKEKSNPNAERTRIPRQHVDIKKATHSFIYKPNGMSEKERNKRLITFFGDLCRNGKYLYVDTDAEIFLKNFTGQHTAEKLLWTAEYKQLRYLISNLHKAGVLKWNSEKPKPGILQMMCIVFQILDNDYHSADDKFDKEMSKHIHDIEVSNLNTTIDKKDEGLDPIIHRLIVKDRDEISESIGEGVASIFSDFQTR